METKLDKLREYRNKYYLEHKQEISAKSKKRHKNNYVKKKRKTTVAKEVDAFRSLIASHDIIINY